MLGIIVRYVVVSGALTRYATCGLIFICGLITICSLCSIIGVITVSSIAQLSFYELVFV